MIPNPDAVKEVVSLVDWTRARMKRIREERRLTQLELAKFCGYKDSSRICDFERKDGDFMISTLFRYAKATRITVDKFFAGCPGWGKQKDEPMVIMGMDMLEAIIAKHTTKGSAQKIMIDIESEMVG